jgi:hypothetical protein
LRAWHAIAPMIMVSRTFIVNRGFFMSSLLLGYGGWLSCMRLRCHTFIHYLTCLPQALIAPIMPVGHTPTASTG